MKRRKLLSSEQIEAEKRRLHEVYLRRKDRQQARREEKRRANLELFAARQREYRMRMKRKTAESIRQRAKDHYCENKAAVLERHRLRNIKNRALMIEAYGGRCVCCGETNPGFLTIDHENGGGRQHRANMGGTGVAASLRRLGWPKEGYRLMCYNCNCGRQHNGGICPHHTHDLNLSCSLPHESQPGRFSLANISK